MNFLSAKQKGVFRYHDHAYDLEPITYPEVNTKNILVIGYPLDVTICKKNPDTMQNIYFDANKLPGYPKLMTTSPQNLPDSARLTLLRGGGIGDIIMLIPSLKHLKKMVGNRITINLSTFADLIPVIEELGYVDNFFPHPIRLYDFMENSDYYMDFSDPKQIFNDTDMIDFHLDSLFFDLGTIPKSLRIPEISEKMKQSIKVIEALNSLSIDNKLKVLFSGKASDRIRHLPPEILDLLSKEYPDMAFIVPSDKSCKSNNGDNIFFIDTTGGLADFITTINRCDMLVSADSSAYHIASALDKPSLVFFGSISSKIRTGNYPKAVALDSDYYGLTCHAPCGISALQETPPTIPIGANGVKILDDDAEIITFDGRSFKFDMKKGCPESNATGQAFSPCLSCFKEQDILSAFEKAKSLINNK